MGWIVESFLEWQDDLWEEIKKDPLKNTALILISPIIIYAMGEALLSFSIFATIGYVVACLYGFSKILDDPYRMVKWGVGYAIGAAVTPLIFSSVWPELQKGTYVSIFSGLVILYVVLMIWFKARELKNE